MPVPVTDRRHIPISAEAALLRAAITASGLSASAYARQVLIREPRTVRRWLAGDSPIPQAVITFLKACAPSG